jgi:hypothetical protein
MRGISRLAADLVVCMRTGSKAVLLTRSAEISGLGANAIFIPRANRNLRKRTQGQ